MTRDGDQYVELDDRVDDRPERQRRVVDLRPCRHAEEAAEVAARLSIPWPTARRTPRRPESPPARTPPTRRPASAEAGHPDVADILFDLRRRETRPTRTYSRAALSDSMRGVGRLNHNPERSAGFVVLKAPDFPSVLVELGYLSNPQDVQSLSSPEWRAKDGSRDGQSDRRVLRRIRETPTAPTRRKAALRPRPHRPPRASAH